MAIGKKDTTAIGKDAAPPEVRAKLGHYPELGRAAAKAIPHATLVKFAGLGHAPQMQALTRFTRRCSRDWRRCRRIAKRSNGFLSRYRTEAKLPGSYFMVLRGFPGRTLADRL
jgi:hypothetical protein